MSSPSVSTVSRTNAGRSPPDRARSPANRAPASRSRSEPLLAEARDRAVRAPTGEEVEGVDDRGALPLRERPVERGGDLGREPALRRVVALQPAREVLQRGEVRGADPPSTAGEQPDQLGAGLRVVDHAERGDEVHHLRLEQQPADAEHVVRHTGPAERGEELGQRAARAHQQRGRRRPARRGERRREPAGDRVGLLRERLREHRVDRVLGGGRRRIEPPDGHAGGGGQGLGDRVRGGEDVGAVAPARAERVHRDRPIAPPKSRAKSSRFAAEAPRQP